MQVVLLVLGGCGWLAPCSGRAVGRGGSALPCLEAPSLEGRELCKAQGCWFGGSAAELVVLLWAFCVLFPLLGVMDGTACPHRGGGEREEAIRDARGEERHRTAHGAHGPSPLHGYLVGRQVPGTVMGGCCCHVGPHAIHRAAWPWPCVLLSLWVGGHPFSGFWRAVPSTELKVAGFNQPLSPLVPKSRSLGPPEYMGWELWVWSGRFLGIPCFLPGYRRQEQADPGLGGSHLQAPSHVHGPSRCRVGEWGCRLL